MPEPLTKVEAWDRLLAERSLHEFVKQAWSIIEPARFVDNWHIEAICDHLEAVARREIRNIIINIPPRCGKSSIINVLFPAWIWLQDPDPKNTGHGRSTRDDAWMGAGVRFLSASYAQNLSIRDNVKARRLIDSPWFQRFWPGRVSFTTDQNTKKYVENMQGGNRFITSVAPGATGEGGDIIIVDDPISADAANSETERESCLRWWFETMPSRLNDQNTGCRIVVMQRLHEMDLSGAILAREIDWDHLMIPMLLEYDHPYPAKTTLGFVDKRILEGLPEGAPLWPERFSDKAMQSMTENMTAYAVAGQYQQRPAPREGGLFKRHWFNLVDTVPATANKRVRSWDFAATMHTGMGDPDWTVGLLMSRDRKTGAFYIEDIKRARVSSHEVERLVLNTADTDGRSIEIRLPKDPGSAGKAVSEYYTRQLAGWRVFPDRETGSKETRAGPMASQAEAGNVYILKKPWTEAFLDEISMFPSGRHDDMVDAASGAFSRLVVKPDPARFIRNLGHMQR